MSTDNKHTKGEWLVSNTINDYTIYADDGSNKGAGKDVALVYRYSRATDEEEAKANARLIAAAPDLLNALIAAHEMLHTLSDNYCRDKYGYLKEDAASKGWDAAIDMQIETAISKATH